ncbi:hypothetical protein DTO166G4_6851 [Paecilomyces variotii]|nr:hypothetical protein DTO166G4_6851 [Paecilomyces variotii]KAJ9232937.1 hypothetical protein DTO166G5_5949 [Paecilomyces variotii]KAJ9262480.1 hypothetical protein DTO195F2_3528 [Paecilomyces variotii]KAJ9289124.1 hypothetical protein DTO021C3_3316 [Paecilomyces variotii]
MESWISVYGLLAALMGMLAEVAEFWKTKILSWWTSRSPKDELFDKLATAETFDEWQAAAFRLDELLSHDLWRQNPVSKHYDHRLIVGRLEAIVHSREEEDVLTLVNLLRSGLVRNLGNIASPKLFNHAFAGTKLLIDDYITQVARSIKYVAALETASIHDSGFTSQAKLELLHDARQAFGRSTLVLQGGSIFGLCHLGVVKALHLQGLLPRIITGTATGALVAALVGVHTEDELLDFLDGDSLDLTAFDRARKSDPGEDVNGIVVNEQEGWTEILKRRVKRFLREGSFFDIRILEECVRANVGDMTFEEAYKKSKRILNITVATSAKSGFPNLLNYLTAPNVLIWSAALASNASTTSLYHPVKLYCKNDSGAIIAWPHSEDIIFKSWRQTTYTDRESPLARIAELFNVNHFIVSQARPYVVPFLRSDLQRPDQKQGSVSQSIMRLVLVEIFHRLKQLDYLGLLPTGLRRLLIDETIPGPNLTILPDLSLADLTKLLHRPSKEGLRYWILRGERGVWPAVSALKVRCAVEIELDKGYQVVRRRRDSSSESGRTQLDHAEDEEESVIRRRRALSFDVTQGRHFAMSSSP